MLLHSLKYFFAIIIFLIHIPVYATVGQCSSYFPGPLQTTAASGSLITFKCGGKIAPPLSSNILITPIVQNPIGSCATTCGTINCSPSGTFVTPLNVGTFKTSTSTTNITLNSNSLTIGPTANYQNITLGNNATLNFTAGNSAGNTVYYIKSLKISGNSSIINFLPGDYWIENFSITPVNTTTLNVVGSGAARIYVKNSMNIQGNNTQINNGDDGRKFFLYTYNDLKFSGNNIMVNAVIYSAADIVTSGNNSQAFKGAMTAKNITIGPNVTFNYAGTAVDNMDFNTICVSSVYFKLNHNAQGSYCQPSTIQLQAKNGSSILTSYNKTVVLNTQTGSGIWQLSSGNGTLTQAIADNGIAEYQFSSLDAGQVTFKLLYTHGNSPVTISVIEKNNSAVRDDQTQGNITFSPCIFKIVESSQGTFCLPQSVTVKVMSGSNQITNYTGYINLTTTSNKGTWSLAAGQGSLIDSVLDDGVAQYQFVANDGGQATFNLSYTNGPAVITVNAVQQNNTNIRDDGTQGTITFYPRALLVTATPLSNPLTSIPAAYSTTQVSGTPQTLYLTAYGLNPNNSVCGIIDGYTGQKPLQFWFNYLDPSTGTVLATINGNNISANTSTPTLIPVNFTNGQASVSAMYPDVGKIAINLQDATPTQPILGATAPFVVKPAQFAISVPNSPSPAPVDATGSVFTKAGAPFTVTVRVLNSLGNVTPNYGNECNGTNPCTPEGIILKSAQLKAPVGGRNGSNNNGVISNGSVFTRSGSGINTLFTGTNFSFDEVGIIELTASVKSGSYMGTGNIVSSFGSLGRFIPYSFQVVGNVPKFNAACLTGGFTYLDQTFSYGTAPELSITAIASSGVTTTNYRDSFWKITNASLNPTYTANQVGLISPSSGLSFVDHLNGTGTYTFDTVNTPGQFKFTRTVGSNRAPFNAEIQLAVTVQDTDGVTYGNAPYLFTFGSIQTGGGIAFNGGKQMLHGRININNVYGSELSSLSPIAMPFTAQYYSGLNGFVTNVQDSCTSFNNINYLILQKNPSNLNTVANVNGFSQGIGNLTLTRPGVSGYTDIEVNLSTLPWLQYDWAFDGNQDGQYNDNPRARATFGIFQGSDHTIYEREVYY